MEPIPEDALEELRDQLRHLQLKNEEVFSKVASVAGQVSENFRQVMQFVVAFHTTLGQEVKEVKAFAVDATTTGSQEVSALRKDVELLAYEVEVLATALETEAELGTGLDAPLAQFGDKVKALTVGATTALSQELSALRKDFEMLTTAVEAKAAPNAVLDSPKFGDKAAEAFEDAKAAVAALAGGLREPGQCHGHEELSRRALAEVRAELGEERKERERLSRCLQAASDSIAVLQQETAALLRGAADAPAAAATESSWASKMCSFKAAHCVASGESDRPSPLLRRRGALEVQPGAVEPEPAQGAGEKPRPVRVLPPAQGAGEIGRPARVLPSPARSRSLPRSRAGSSPPRRAAPGSDFAAK